MFKGGICNLKEKAIRFAPVDGSFAEELELKIYQLHIFVLSTSTLNTDFFSRFRSRCHFKSIEK